MRNTTRKAQTNKDSNTNPMVTYKDKYIIEYFAVGPKKGIYKEASVKLTESIYYEFKDMFSGISHLKGKFPRRKQTVSGAQRCVPYVI